jgi:hypothetical protein
MTVSSKTNAYTLAASDYCVIFTGASTVMFTLPAANTCLGRVYLLVNQSSVSLTTSTYYAGSAVATTAVAAGTNAQIVSDGVKWRKIN